MTIAIPLTVWPASHDTLIDLPDERIKPCQDQIPLLAASSSSRSYCGLIAGVRPTLVGASAYPHLPPDDHALRRVVTIPFASREDLAGFNGLIFDGRSVKAT